MLCAYKVISDRYSLLISTVAGGAKSNIKRHLRFLKRAMPFLLCDRTRGEKRDV